MNRFQELQNQHLELLAHYEQDKESHALLADVQVYAEQVALASKEISDSRERNQLRANLRFWGAFIYERTGTYPNLNLLPAEEVVAGSASSIGPRSPAAVKAPPSFSLLTRATLVILMGLAIITIILLPILLSRKAQNAPGGQSTAPVGMITQTPLSSSPTAAGAYVSLTPTPTGTPISALPTYTAQAGFALPTATSNLLQLPPPLSLGRPPGVLIPVTGGGGEESPSLVEASYGEAECSTRTVSINMIPFSLDLTPGTPPEQPTLVRLSVGGSGETVYQQLVPAGEQALTIELSNSRSDQSLLLQLQNPEVVFQPVILQFFSDCSRNQTQITMHYFHSNHLDEYYKIQLDLLTWGAGYNNQSWIAKLRLRTSQEGIFWLDASDDRGPQSAQLIGEYFYVEAPTCAPAKFVIAETTGGHYVERWYTLYSPMSFCEYPTASPTIVETAISAPTISETPVPSLTP